MLAPSPPSPWQSSSPDLRDRYADERTRRKDQRRQLLGEPYALSVNVADLRERLNVSL
jgi:hypothetical protein